MQTLFNIYEKIAKDDADTYIQHATPIRVRHAKKTQKNFARTTTTPHPRPNFKEDSPTNHSPTSYQWSPSATDHGNYFGIETKDICRESIFFVKKFKIKTTPVRLKHRLCT